MFKGSVTWLQFFSVNLDKKSVDKRQTTNSARYHVPTIDPFWIEIKVIKIADLLLIFKICVIMDDSTSLYKPVVLSFVALQSSVGLRRHF